MSNNFTEGLERVVGIVPELVDTNQFQSQLRQKVQHNFSNLEELSGLTQMTSAKKTALQEILKTEEGRRILKYFLDRFTNGVDFKKLAELFVTFIKESGAIPQATEEGHINGLRTVLSRNDTPEVFKAPHWNLVASETKSVVLGDSCMVAVDKDGQSHPLLRLGKDWKEIYFPISSQVILVAQKEQGTPSLKVREINQAVIETARDYFYAASVNDETLGFVDSIAKNMTFFTDQHMVNLLSRYTGK